MKKLSLLLLLFLSSLSLSSLYGMEGKTLSEIKCSGASVLPTYRDANGVKRVILARENIEGRSCDKGTWDDFSGKAERCDKHPVISASREFWEEAILDGTIGLTPEDTSSYIDEDNSFTEHIVVYQNTHKGRTATNIVYITGFTPYAQQLLSNFYSARNQTLRRSSREKDRIGTISWDDLKNTIANAKRGTPVEVMLSVVDPVSGETVEEMGTLRPIFAAKLKLFFQGRNFYQGAHSKVRFYSWDYVDKCVGSSGKEQIGIGQQ